MQWCWSKWLFQILQSCFTSFSIPCIYYSTEERAFWFTNDAFCINSLCFRSMNELIKLLIIFVTKFMRNSINLFIEQKQRLLIQNASWINKNSHSPLKYIWFIELSKTILHDSKKIIWRHHCNYNLKPSQYFLSWWHFKQNR